MKIFLGVILSCFAFALLAASPSEAPAGFDNKTNGMVDDATHAADQAQFEAVLNIAEGLGPLYNAQSCRECHQNPVSGGISQVTELRVGHLGPHGIFENPSIPIAHGAETITGRSLVNDRAICPNAQFPNEEIQERVPDTETIRTLRTSLNLLGDGFVEALSDETLLGLAHDECNKTHKKICGLAIYVPVVEAPGQTRIGRFGWKDQHSSLLSFAADAYLNEMGITNRLFPDEVTNLCNTVSEPNDNPKPGELAHIDHFAEFIRATKAPPRDEQLAATPQAKRGEALFDKIGCSTCHVPTLTTAAAGTKIDGGTFTLPDALGDETFHPYSDFLLHDVGTGDGIVMSMTEHYGKNVHATKWQNLSMNAFQQTRNKMRTPPLWGVRTRTRLMHDGASLTFPDAILRHRGEAEGVTERFQKLKPADRQALIEFLKSL
jgi:CxxC motif-containing protein (DUF1111 family)